MNPASGMTGGWRGPRLARRLPRSRAARAVTAAEQQTRPPLLSPKSRYFCAPIDDPILFSQCTRRYPIGSWCSADGDCVEGAACRRYEGEWSDVCERLPGADEPCAATAPLCDNESYCDAEHICRAKARLGEACDAIACGPGLVCANAVSDGTCGPGEL